MLEAPALGAAPSVTQPFRVIVTGSRTWGRPDAVGYELSRLLIAHAGTGLTVVHGDCPQGADRHAADWCKARQMFRMPVTEEPHPAQWEDHGRRAGYLRNEEMVNLGADLALAFAMPCVKAGCSRRRPHMSHGTAHALGLARTAGIPVRVIEGDAK